jgi:hypothetical protein
MSKGSLIALAAALLSGCATFEPAVVSDAALVSDQYASYRPAAADRTPGAGGLGGAGAGAAPAR